jgi:hypothetical protein
MLLAARRTSATSGDRPVRQTPVEPPALEGRKLRIDASNKYSNDTEVKFKRIVIAKTATINMMKHNIR